jgi:hypothetical protein
MHRNRLEAAAAVAVRGEISRNGNSRTTAMEAEGALGA